MANTATPISTPLGSYEASRVYSPALMARAIKARTFLNDLSAPIQLDSWQVTISATGKATTASGMPIVKIMDLAKTAGDRVTADILDRLGGKVVMGDRIAKNSGNKMTHLRDEVRIDQTRYVVDAGGRASQQRTPHDLRMNGQGLGLDYFNNFLDNQIQVHLAGTRGAATGIDWKMSLASEPEFEDEAINPVLAPTNTRYVGLSSSVTHPGQVSTTNVLTLNFFDDLRTINDTSQVPLQGVKMYGNDGDVIEGERSPLLLSFISSEQWNQLQKETSGQNWRTFVTNATERLAWTKHPLFKSSQCGLWRDILICQAPRAIELPVGFNVAYNDANDAAQTATMAVRAHRGTLLGAQAAAFAMGNASRWTGADAGTGGSKKSDLMGVPFSWVEKLEDGDNLLQFFIAMMGGMKKLRYNFDGRPYDNGVFAFDSFVPALR